MRITTVMMGNHYKKNLQANQAALFEAEQTADNYRKFQTIADDPASAAKAFQLRRELTKNEAHLRNAEMADGRMKTAESSMSNIQEQVKDVYDRLIQGNNGTLGPEDKEIIAKDLRGIQQALLQELNVSYTDQYLFGGSVTGVPPVAVGADGKMTFRGVSLEGPQVPAKNENESDKEYADRISAYNEASKEFEKTMEAFESETIITDFGYGINSTDDDSGFDISLSAVKLMGYGVDDKGMSNNLYNLVGQMADYLENADTNGYDEDVFGEYIEKFNDVKGNFLNELTKMGEKSKTISYTVNRLETNKLSLQEKQSYVETVKPEEALSDFKYQEFAFRASLAIGTKIIQPSLLDYLS